MNRNCKHPEEYANAWVVGLEFQGPAHKVRIFLKRYYNGHIHVKTENYIYRHMCKKNWEVSMP